MLKASKALTYDDSEQYIGFDLEPGVSVNIRMKRRTLERVLSRNDIEFNAAYDVKSEAYSETVMVIPKYCIELTLRNDMINYIKSDSMPHSILASIGDSGSIDTMVADVVDKLKEKTNGQCSIRLERFDSDSMSILASMRNDIRIGVSRTKHGDVYISTLRDLSNY